MAKLNVTNVLVGVGAGIVDEIIEWQDEKATPPRTESFKTWADWSRLVLCAGGYLGQIFDFMPNITTPLAQSYSTLMVKSVGKAIRGQAAAGVTRRVATTNRVPVQTRVAHQQISRSYQPEFEKAGAF